MNSFARRPDFRPAQALSSDARAARFGVDYDDGRARARGKPGVAPWEAKAMKAKVFGTGAGRHIATVGLLLLAGAAAAAAQRATVDITPSHQLNAFSPLRALGAGVDRDPLNSTATLFDGAHVSQMLSSGYGAISYRLNTELSVQAWHWNPAGIWSDSGKQGYFVGSANPAGSILRSYGYDLPHRGGGFQLTGGSYSRLDDGNLGSYWKSNPYLDQTYTGEDNSLHPQWVVIDLGAVKAVNGIKIVWGDPYATSYQVQYWTGADAIYDPAHGSWKTFSSGTISNGKGGTVTLKLASATVNAQFVRVLLTAASKTCDSHGAGDLRNCLGFSIKELYLGKLNGNVLTDYMVHSTDSSQTAIYVSSNDPWHSKSDTATEDGEQPGFDRVYNSGVTRGLPMTVPVAMLYDVPDNAKNEIAYLEAKGFPINYVEMGEEPDGQFVLPEDYGALYLQWATAIHSVDPAVRLAGPIFTGENTDIPVWPDASGNTSWFTRFLNYLNNHGRIGDLNVMTYEHYPFDPCNIPWSSLYAEPGYVQGIVQTWKNDGLPADVPQEVTEYNLAFDQSVHYMQPFAALWHADFVGSFLANGGQAAYFYQYEPLPMYQGCGGWGTFSLFVTDGAFNIKQQDAEFFSSQILTQQWAQPVDAMHLVYPASTDITDGNGNVLVTAYSVQRPDGQWSVLLVNKDQNQPHSLTLTFTNADGNVSKYFSGSVTQVSFGSDNYVWHPAGINGYASPDGPAVTTTANGGAGTVYVLPKASVTVLRGSIQ